MTRPGRSGPHDAYITGDRIPVGEVFEDASDATWDLWMLAVCEQETRLAMAAMTAPSAPAAPAAQAAGATAYDDADRVFAGVRGLRVQACATPATPPSVSPRSHPFFNQR